MTRISTSPVRQIPSILVVEDSNEDFEALQRLLRRSPTAIPIHRCVNGHQALEFLCRTGSYGNREHAPRPSLIVLDLNLPGINGREVLYRIKQDENLKSIPVIVFTTSNNLKDVEDCYRYGVNSYIVKPINFEKLKRDVQMLVDYWFEVTVLPDSP